MQHSETNAKYLRERVMSTDSVCSTRLYVKPIDIVTPVWDIEIIQFIFEIAALQSLS